MKPPPALPLEQRLADQQADLPLLLDRLEALAQDRRWTDVFRSQVMLVIEELVVNALTYGGRDTGQAWVKVQLLESVEGLEIRITDNGDAFDPFVEAPEPSLDLDLDSRAVGGLGVHFVREMTDTRTYQRQNDENHVVLFKRWQASSTD
ncbi:MAG: hypothetical protein RL322_1624 [Pseudomonadota bacterium]|jgi:serine/threonine-protein kinase RsbW